MNEFKNILINNNFCIAYYSKKKEKDYATLKCKIISEYPTSEEFNIFISSIKHFYDNIIDKELKYKIKLDIKKMGFIGFSNVYECVTCFRNEYTVSINENILIDTIILISNSKLKYLLDSIFIFLKPTKPIIFKCSDDINELNDQEQNDITNSIIGLFEL